MLEEIAAPGFLPSLFARRAETTPAAVSKVLRQLLDRGLVVASIAEADARQRRYELTADGRWALARIEAAREDAVRAVWRPFGARDIRRFAELADKLSALLEAHARSRRPPGSTPPREGAA